MESMLAEGQTVVYQFGEGDSLEVLWGLVLSLVLFNELEDGVSSRLMQGFAKS